MASGTIPAPVPGPADPPQTNPTGGVLGAITGLLQPVDPARETFTLTPTTDTGNGTGAAADSTLTPGASSASYHADQTDTAGSDKATINSKHKQGIWRAWILAGATRWAKGGGAANKRLDLAKARAQANQVKENRTVTVNRSTGLLSPSVKSSGSGGSGKGNGKPGGGNSPGGRGNSNGAAHRNGSGSGTGGPSGSGGGGSRNGGSGGGSSSSGSGGGKPSKGSKGSGGGTGNGSTGSGSGSGGGGKNGNHGSSGGSGKNSSNGTSGGGTSNHGTSGGGASGGKGKGNGGGGKNGTSGHGSGAGGSKPGGSGSGSAGGPGSNGGNGKNATTTTTCGDGLAPYNGNSKNNKKQKNQPTSAAQNTQSPPNSAQKGSQTTPAPVPTASPLQASRETGYRDGASARKVYDHVAAYGRGAKDGWTDTKEASDREHDRLDKAHADRKKTRDHNNTPKEQPVAGSTTPQQPAQPIPVTGITKDDILLGDGALKPSISRGELRTFKNFERRFQVRKDKMIRIADATRSLQVHADGQVRKANRLLDQAKQVKGGDKVIAALTHLQDAATVQVAKADEVNTRATRSADGCKALVANVATRYGGMYQAVVDADDLTEPAEMSFYQGA